MMCFGAKKLSTLLYKLVKSDYMQPKQNVKMTVTLVNIVYFARTSRLWLNILC